MSSDAGKSIVGKEVHQQRNHQQRIPVKSKQRCANSFGKGRWHPGAIQRFCQIDQPAVPDEHIPCRIFFAHVLPAQNPGHKQCNRTQ
jgi:hypothetical protein